MTPIATLSSSPDPRGDSLPPSVPAIASRRCRGFTLIELMIAIVVVGILATIALPSYTDYIRRGRITEATNALATQRVRLEQYFQDNGNYGSNAGACGLAAASTDAFDLACSDGGGGSGAFVATATGKASKNMDGYAFSIDQDNRRRTTAFPGTSGLPLDCWIDRKGASC